MVRLFNGTACIQLELSDEEGSDLEISAAVADADGNIIGPMTPVEDRDLTPDVCRELLRLLLIDFGAQ